MNPSEPTNLTHSTNPTNPSHSPLLPGDPPQDCSTASERPETAGVREARQAADLAASSIREALGTCVTGIYLHGSLAIGGFNPASSDIDLLVVVRERPERDRLYALTRSLLDVHQSFPEGRDLEFSVVEEAVLHHFVHPTPCVYHYSGVHRQRYASDPDYLCADYEDADLAAQITVAYERGVALYGQPLRDLYPPVPRADYLESVWSDVSNAEAEIVDNSVYLTLNLCRMLMFMEEGAVASKKEGGEWAVKSLPEWSDIVRPVFASYQGEAESPPAVPESRLKAFAHAMLQVIGEKRPNVQP